MPAILPKDCCDCAVVVDACQCAQDYLVTSSGTYTGNYSRPLDCENGIIGYDFNFTSSFSDITDTLAVSSDASFPIGGSVPCGTTGSSTDTFCDFYLSCKGGLKDVAILNYVLCGGESSCDEVDNIETTTLERPSAGYSGTVVSQRLTSGPNAGNYIFSISEISINTNYYLSWSDTPGGTETGTLTLTQDFLASQNISLYGTWNLPAGLNSIHTKSGSCALEIDISKSV